MLNTRAILRALILLLLLLITSTTAQAATTHISSLPYEINTSGYYVLDTDCSNADWNYAIKINASDVVLDGNGHTLDGLLGTYGVKAENVNNVTIENLTVTDWYSGIYWDNVDGGSIAGCTASSNTHDGIHLLYSSNNTLTNNTVSDNDWGIYLTSSSNNTLTGNNVSSNSNRGIYLSSSSYNTLTDNNASSNSDHGIYLGSSSNNTLTSNTVSSNSNRGIYLSSSSNNTLTDNTFTGCGLFVSSGSEHNTLSGNTVNGRQLVYLEDASDTTISDTANTPDR